MTTTLDNAPQLGDGIYTFPQAAAILARPTRNLTTRRLRYWMTSGLAPASYSIGQHPLLTFYDLISLEVVARFTEDGWSVQGVRRIEEELREEFGRPRPFAYKAFYTDGRSVWAKVSKNDQIMTELISKHRDRRHKSLAWADAVETFADEIRFEGTDQAASAWQLSPWVEINPQIQFGAPVVRGTRVPISTVKVNLEVGSPGEVADWYDLTLEEVHGVRDYVALS
jgi:uncharacterized protein (DUF433 family)